VTAAVLADQVPGQPQGVDELAAEREALGARLIERHFDAHIRPGEGRRGSGSNYAAAGVRKWDGTLDYDDLGVLHCNRLEHDPPSGPAATVREHRRCLGEPTVVERSGA
jgi:hypothetical protein